MEGLDMSEIGMGFPALDDYQGSQEEGYDDDPQEHEDLQTAKDLRLAGSRLRLDHPRI